MRGAGWYASWRGVARQAWRSPAVFAAGGVPAAVWLVGRAPGFTKASWAALVPLRAADKVGAHEAATILGLLVPLVAMAVVLVGQENLSGHRRALLAALPDRTWTRFIQGFLTVLLWAGLSALMATILPYSAHLIIAPDQALIWLLPAVLAVSGMQTLLGESSRQPLVGLAAAFLWLAISFVAENIPSRPLNAMAVLMLTPATVYPVSPTLWRSALLTGALGVLMWIAALGVGHYHRKKGWDV